MTKEGIQNIKINGTTEQTNELLREVAYQTAFQNEQQAQIYNQLRENNTVLANLTKRALGAG